MDKLLRGARIARENDVFLDEVDFEVEGVEDQASALAAFTVCRVKEARQHPNADRLRVCDVETRDGLVQVVCGAPNARTGLVGIWKACGELAGLEMLHAVERGRPVHEGELHFGDGAVVQVIARRATAG